MRYAKIRKMDIVNGVGIACSIFFQGCPYHCKGCFNESTWDFNGGMEFTKDKQDKFIELCNQPFIDCISLLGGEPLAQPNDELLQFVIRLKQEVGKPIFMWTGDLYENVKDNDIVQHVDTLIDGRFIESLKDVRLHLKGSSNQRVINVQESIKQNKIIMEEYNG